jgi:hypothetical protein
MEQEWEGAMTTVLLYQSVRVLKWLLWIAFAGYSWNFVLDGAPHLNQFGHLTFLTEMVMFGLPLVAVIAGLFQMCLWDVAYGEGSN